jgi:hypothetical protein
MIVKVEVPQGAEEATAAVLPISDDYAWNVSAGMSMSCQRKPKVPILIAILELPSPNGHQRRSAEEAGRRQAVRVRQVPRIEPRGRRDSETRRAKGLHVAPGRACTRVRIKGVRESFERPGLEQIVGVDTNHIRCGRQANTSHHRGSGPLIRLVHHPNARPGQVLEEIKSCAVSRTVVDDDKINRLACANRGHCLTQRLAVVVARDHDGDAGHRRQQIVVQLNRRDMNALLTSGGKARVNASATM